MGILDKERMTTSSFELHSLSINGDGESRPWSAKGKGKEAVTAADFGAATDGDEELYSLN